MALVFAMVFGSFFSMKSRACLIDACMTRLPIGPLIFGASAGTASAEMATEVAETLKTKAISLKLGCIVLIPFGLFMRAAVCKAVPAMDFVIARVMVDCGKNNDDIVAAAICGQWF